MAQRLIVHRLAKAVATMHLQVAIVRLDDLVAQLKCSLIVHSDRTRLTVELNHGLLLSQLGNDRRADLVKASFLL